MARTSAGLVDEIQAIVGRTENQVLIDNTRCTHWVNEAQNKIVEQCPALHSLVFDNKTSLDTTVTLSYPLSDITVGDISVEDRVCHIFDVWYLDGLESRKLVFMHTDVFDENWPDPTHTNVPKERSINWTRRGNNIEMMPLCLTAYCDKDLRFQGDAYPREFTTGDVSLSDVSGGDSAIIAYGVWQAWAAINSTENELKWKIRFYRLLEEIRDQNNTLHEWSGNLYDD